MSSCLDLLQKGEITPFAVGTLLFNLVSVLVCAFLLLKKVAWHEWQMKMHKEPYYTLRIYIFIIAIVSRVDNVASQALWYAYGVESFAYRLLTILYQLGFTTSFVLVILIELTRFRRLQIVLKHSRTDFYLTLVEATFCIVCFIVLALYVARQPFIEATHDYWDCQNEKDATGVQIATIRKYLEASLYFIGIAADFYLSVTMIRTTIRTDELQQLQQVSSLSSLKSSSVAINEQQTLTQNTTDFKALLKRNRMKFRLKIKLIAFYSLLMFLDLLALTASGVVEAVPILRQSYTIEFDALTGVWFVFRIWGMIELLEMFKGGLESVKKLRAVVVMSDTATTQERLTPTLPRVVHLSLSTKKQDRQTPSSRSHNLQPDYKSVNIFMSNSNAHSSSNNKPNNNVMSVSEPPLTE